MGRSSPWGKIDHTRKYVRGLSFVSTPSHGGFRVGKKLAQRMPEHVKNGCGQFLGGYWYFEEDCAAAAVPIYFPEYFLPEQVANAKLTLARWYPALQVA